MELYLRFFGKVSDEKLGISGLSKEGKISEIPNCMFTKSLTKFAIDVAGNNDFYFQ